MSAPEKPSRPAWQIVDDLLAMVPKRKRMRAKELTRELYLHAVRELFDHEEDDTQETEAKPR